MLRLSKKADYALMAMKHLALRGDRGSSSAREIAEQYDIPIELMAKVLANARLWSDGLVERGFKVVRHGDLVTPIVPVLVEDDWKAGLLWKALYESGVYVNVAIHPAVPPGGALLRTSVMATHDTPTLERALDAFASVKASFEAEHGPLPSAS